MTAVAPLYVVDGPQPSRRPYTLLGAANVVTEGNDRWAVGVTTADYSLALPGTWAPCLGVVKPKARQGGSGDFPGYAVVGGMECTTKGALAEGDLGSFQARLDAAFLANEDAAVEDVFMHGESHDATIPSLVGRAALANASTTMTTVLGIAELERWFADNFGSLGVMHVSPRLATVMKSKGVLEYASVSGSNRIGTVNGTPVVPGAGYDGAKPAAGTGAATGTIEWAYITGQVDIRRGLLDHPAPDIASALKRSTNDVTVYTERFYVHTFDTDAVAAVKIDLAT